MAHSYTLDELLVEYTPSPDEPEYWAVLEPPRMTELIPLNPREEFASQLAEGLRSLADAHHVSLEYVAGVAYGMLKGEKEAAYGRA